MLTVAHYLQTKGRRKNGKKTYHQSTKRYANINYLIPFKKKALFGVSSNSKPINQKKDSNLNLFKLILKLEKKIESKLKVILRSIPRFTPSMKQRVSEESLLYCTIVWVFGMLAWGNKIIEQASKWEHFNFWWWVLGKKVLKIGKMKKAFLVKFFHWLRNTKPIPE